MKPNKFTNDLSQIPIHSSGLVEANGDVFGSLSPESFNQRKQLEQNRRLIRGYGDSHVGRGYGERPSVSDRPQGRSLRPAARPNRQEANTKSPIFREPPSRGYNPYS